MENLLVRQRARGDAPGAAALSDHAFMPRGIAVYGASNRAGTMGLRLASLFGDGRYPGNVCLVNARLQAIGTIETVDSAVGRGTLDHALIAVPAVGVCDAIKDAAAAGIAVASIFSGGFSESGADGSRLEAEVLATARACGVRLIGPNSLGFINVRDGIKASPAGTPELALGSISVVAQSGSVAGRLAAGLADNGAGLDLWLSIGNCLDIGPAELIRYLAGRPSTRTVILYLEDLGPVADFEAAMAEARDAGLQVVVLKSGRSAAGLRSTSSHTGASASPDLFVDLLLREAGALRVDSVQEACDVALLAGTGIVGRGAIMAPSGGDCALAADRCGALGLPLATISDAGQRAMREVVPFCAPHNPVDPTTLMFKDDNLDRIIAILRAEPEVDYLIYQSSTSLVLPHMRDIVVPVLVQAHRAGLPVIVGAPTVPESRAPLDAAGIGVLQSGERAVAAVARILRADPNGREAVSPAKASEPVAASGSVLLGELEAIAALTEAGLPMVRTVTVEDESALASLVAEMKPMALKGVLPAIGHKSELGLVKLNLGTIDEAHAAFADLVARTRDVPGSRIVAQPMVAGIAELILGALVDPRYGKHVMIGMGGVFTDFIAERSWARVPVDRARALRMVSALRIGPGLLGAREGVGGDMDGIIDAILKLSAWLEQRDDIREVEINPLIVRRRDVVAVDALVGICAARVQEKSS